MVIRTVNDKKIFKASEKVEFVELYTSSIWKEWHIEVLENWNESSVSDKIFISDGKQSLALGSVTQMFICCRSRHVWLDDVQTQIPYKASSLPEYSLHVPYRWLKLPARPGKYQIYVTSHRVFGRDIKLSTPTSKGVPVTSKNILELEVVN